jgi:CubicO group peptidase (beta-lactamase class C family)
MDSLMPRCLWLSVVVLPLASLLAEPPVNSVVQSLKPFVDDQVLAGAVALVADNEKVLDVGTIGWADISQKKPMRADTVFWIASMTKAITAAAVMTLVDEGLIKMDHPLTQYLPEFREQRVIVELDEAHTLLKPPVKPITLQDLLCHTSGLPFKSALEQPTLDALPLSVAVASHAAAPLIYQPDAKYQYSNAGINTAGRVLEIVLGQSYEAALDERILKPLGMKDTTFWPNDEQVSRLALSYRPTEDKSGLESFPISQLQYPLQDKGRYPMPGGGLFSTAADVARFCQMLLNQGLHEGKRILSKEAVKAMTQRQTPTDLKESYGYGLQVQADSYGHGGAHATNMKVHVTDGLVSVFLVQHAGWRNESGKQILPTFEKAALSRFGKK